MIKIVIVDYGLGNIRSISHKLKSKGLDAVVSSDANVIAQADRLILGGVGHFGKGMENLKDRGLVNILNKKVMNDRTPIFGICLGMQMMTHSSQEGNIPGLGWIDAETIKFDFGDNEDLSIPHVGFNSLILRKNNTDFKIKNKQLFYFTHSYYVRCQNECDVLAETQYGIKFVSAFFRDNMIGTQFHPEKSHYEGFNLLLKFCK